MRVKFISKSSLFWQPERDCRSIDPTKQSIHETEIPLDEFIDSKERRIRSIPKFKATMEVWKGDKLVVSEVELGQDKLSSLEFHPEKRRKLIEEVLPNTY